MTAIPRRKVVLAGLASAGVAALPVRPARAAVKELAWSTWESNGKPAFSKAFTGRTGIAIRSVYMTSDDAQFAALRTGAGAEWDVLSPSINGIERYIKAGVLQPLDEGKLPGAALLYDMFKTNKDIRGPDGKLYAMPYLWGLNPIVYRKDVLPEEPGYEALFDARWSGKLAMRDYALESVAIAGLYVGVPRERVFQMSAAELGEARKALLAQKKILRTYWQSIGDLTNLFATGEVVCAFSWRVPYDVLHEKMPMGMAKPKAGIMGWCDCAAIPTRLSGEVREAAHGFIDYLLGPDYASATATDEGGHYATSTSVIRDKLDQQARANIFIDDLDLMKSFLWPKAPANYSDWIKLWNEVKAA
jgi:spermidine/putrescine-binding protein